jgi:thioredoxin-related protein
MIKMFAIFSILMAVGLSQVYSQNDTTHGIAFEHGLSWQEVLQKAAKENKYVFVDCYASWCGPCKWMDKNVFEDDTVGDFMNKDFISVKIQMDSTRHDTPEIQQWYLIAHAFERQYRISGYPSYLFFSPGGGAIHKSVGSLELKDFLTLVKTAVDPRQQYYTLLSRYQHGELDYEAMTTLANMAHGLGEDSLAASIAGYYLHHLEGLSDQQLWIKDNIDFINGYRQILHSGDMLFQRYLKYASAIDSIMGRKGYADGLLSYMVYHEEVRMKVDAGIKNKVEPNWKKIEKEIVAKYGQGYEHVVTQGRVKYYLSIKQWEKFATCLVRQIKESHVENWSPGSDGTLNTAAFEVFEYSRKKEELEQALSWINKAIAMHTDSAGAPSYEIDTKANLLYKLRRQAEGIALEEQAARLAPGDNEIQTNYARMKKGLSTWALPSK